MFQGIFESKNDPNKYRTCIEELCWMQSELVGSRENALERAAIVDA